MRRFFNRASLLLLVAGAPACSLVIETGPYVGPGRDAGPDSNVPADAPTTPVVRIAPESPVGSDVLTVEIVTESTDPLNGGAVTYEYRWLEDDADASITATTVPADRTERGEVWAVEVTPVSADGARRGAPGAASVTIGNAPPNVAYVGLDSYRPVAGDTLAVFTGPTADADGDPVSLRYAWFKNDVVIEGQTSNRLDTSRVTVAPGDRLRVEATARDAEGDGNTVTAGPAILLEDTTRWRQLLPQRVLPRASFVTFDPVHRRVIFAYAEGEDFTGVKMWEFALDDAVGGRLTQLFPTGVEPPLTFGIPIYDAANQRVLLFGAQGDIDSGTLSSDVYALDVSQRGNESWSVLAPSGDLPPPRFVPSVAYDAERQQVLMYGGFDFVSGGVFNDLWVLDLAAAGAESWEQLAVPLPTAAVVGPALAIDVEGDRAIMAGGAEATDLGGDPTPSLAIYTLDLTNPSAGFGTSAETLPRPVLLPTTGVDTESGRMLIALGSGPDDAVWADAIAIDLATLTATIVTPSGEGPIGGGRGLLVDDPYGEHLLFPGVPFFDAEPAFDLYAWDTVGDALTPIHRTGVDLPPPLEDALGVGDFTIYGGEDHRGTLREEVWRLGSSARWTRITTTPDAITGLSPGPRAGAVLQSASQFGAELQFFGGRTPAGTADGQMWLLRDTGWIQQTLATGQTPPVGREGAAFFVPACGGWRSGYFGGLDGSNTYRNDTGFLDCLSGERECQWTDPAGATRPPVRAYAAAVRHDDDSRVVVYGGEQLGAPLGDVWTLYTCGGGPQPWEPATVTGTAPAARSRHSMTLVPATAGALESLLVVGGSNNGEPLGDAARLVRLGSTSYRWDPVPVASGPNDEQLSERYGHVATWDEDRSRLLVYGGHRRGETLGDMWELRVRP